MDDRKKPRRDRSADRVPRRRCLTVSELDRLLRQAPDPRTRALAGLASSNGARLAELSALRWADVDTANRQIHLGTPKCRIPRLVRLEPKVAALLEHLRSLQSGGDSAVASPGAGYVFASGRGIPSSPQLLSETFRLDALRVCGRPISLHELRLWALRRRRG